MEVYHLEIYERIKLRRKELCLTAEDVATALNVSRATVYRYESADIEKFPITLIEPLSKVLRCSPAYLMGWDENATFFSLYPIEKKVITKYRDADDLSRAMVHRALGMEEEISGKKGTA